MSSLLTEPLNLHLQQLQFDTIEERPYLFFPSGDPTRCYTSSQWCSTVKSAFQKHSGESPPPKLLRASFVRRPSLWCSLCVPRVDAFACAFYRSHGFETKKLRQKVKVCVLYCVCKPLYR